MLTEQAKRGLARILEISCPNDVKIIELKFVPGMPYSTSQEEAAEAILQHVLKPSEILRQKNIKKDTIAVYLEEIGVFVPKELSKDACIRTCLEKWHVKDDNFWVKQRKPKEKILGGMPHLDNRMSREIGEGSQHYQIQTNKLMEILDSIQEQNPLSQLKNQENKDEVQVLPPTVILTESESMESMESLLIRLPSWNGVSEQQRNSATLTSSSQIDPESINLTDELQSLLPESFPPAVSKPERNQPILQSVPPRCSSAPIYHAKQKQSTFPSKTLHSFSSGGNLSSRMLLPKRSSTDPSIFSSSLQNTGHLFTVENIESEGEPVSVSPSSSAVNSRRICKQESESPEPPPTEALNFAPRSVEIDSLPSVGIMRRSVPVSPDSSLNSHEIRKTKQASSEVKQLSPSKPLICAASISNASVQTLLSGDQEHSDNGNTVSQINRSYRRSPEKQLLSPNEIWPPLETNTLNYKRRPLQHPEEVCGFSCRKNRKEPLSLPKKNTAVSERKWNRCSSASNPEDPASDFRNVKKCQSTLPKCPHCKKQYFSSCLHGDSHESGDSSKPEACKKKRPSSLSKDAASPSKQRRLTVPSKRAKKASIISHESPGPSTLLTKTKVSKRKYPTASPETLSHHGSKRQPTGSSKQQPSTSAISSEHPKQPKLLKKVYHRRNNAFLNSKSEDGASASQTVMREPITSKLRTSESESSSSTDSPPSNNSINKITDPPSRSPSIPPELLSVSESKLKTQDSASDTSDENENQPTETPDSPALSKPRRHCCTLL